MAMGGVKVIVTLHDNMSVYLMKYYVSKDNSVGIKASS